MNTLFKILYLIFFIILAMALLKFLLAFTVIMLVLLWLRTWQMKKEPNQKAFVAGSLPNPKPDGFYNGSIGFDTAWVGKKFNAQDATGINVLQHKPKSSSAQNPVVLKDKYPFKTYAGKGLFDPDTFVLKIDYNVPGNPFWIKWIVDEIVEITPNEYLGKMHLKLIPGFPFSVLYFELKK